MPAAKPKDTPIKPLPHWALSMSEIQNQLGIAYVHAVLYHAGCKSIEHTRTDIGIDFTVRYVDLWQGGPVDGDVLDIQLKSSYSIIDDGNNIKYHMDRVAYDKLRRPDPKVPQVFVLYAMPRDPASWLDTSGNFLAIRHRAYWADMRGFKAKRGTKPLVVVPKSQAFDASALQGPIRDLVESWKTK